MYLGAKGKMKPLACLYEKHFTLKYTNRYLKDSLFVIIICKFVRQIFIPAPNGHVYRAIFNFPEKSLNFI